MAAGDQQGLSSLYDRYRSVVFPLALRILKDRAEAEEVMTDVFFQAWRHAEAFDRNRGSVPSWIITLCRLRSRGRRETGMTILAREEMGKATRGDCQGIRQNETADLQLKRQRIGEALGTLSPQQKDAIEMVYYGDLSHSGIATKLGEPLGTVKSRIRQALLPLRESRGAQFER